MEIYGGHLYHGTDKKILRMSEQGREERARLCKQIADYSYSILQKNDVVVSPYTEKQKKAKEVLSDIWFDLWNQGIIRYTGWMNENPLYQYDYLYVSNNYDRAASYAKNSFIFGERGNVAYRLYQGAKRFNDFYTEMTDEMKISLKAFDEMVGGKREPIVVILNNLRKEDIQTENGKDIDWDTNGDCILDKDVVESFRIINNEKYDLTTMEYRSVRR